MDRFSVLMAKRHIFEPQFPSYVYLYYISPSGGYNDLPYRWGSLASEFPSELWSLLFFFIVNIQFIGSIEVVCICWCKLTVFSCSGVFWWSEYSWPRMRSFKGSNFTSFRLSFNKVGAFQHLVLTQRFLSKLKALALQLQMSKCSNCILRTWKHHYSRLKNRNVRTDTN